MTRKPPFRTRNDPPGFFSEYARAKAGEEIIVTSCKNVNLAEFKMVNKSFVAENTDAQTRADLDWKLDLRCHPIRQRSSDKSRSNSPANVPNVAFVSTISRDAPSKNEFVYKGNFQDVAHMTNQKDLKGNP